MFKIEHQHPHRKIVDFSGNALGTIFYQPRSSHPQETGAMAYSDRDFKILDALESQKITSQRQLAILTGISLGQVNYALRSLLAKGMVKLDNFKKNPHKSGYAYLITPTGIETKSKLAVRFVIERLNEYNRIRNGLLGKLNQIEFQDQVRTILVGPEQIRDLIQSIITDNNINFLVMGHCIDVQELQTFDPGFFDLAILFCGTQQEQINALAATGISKAKVLHIW